MMEIVVYEGEYDRSGFYSKMGKYFAEKEYQNELPYLHNEDEKIWFVAMEEGEVAGFASLVIENTKIVKKHLEKLGFEIYRQTKNYWFLRKEAKHEK